LWPYLITFELTDCVSREKALSAVLRDMGAVALTANAWLMTSDWNACAILEQLRPIIGKEDRLVVLEISEDVAAMNVEHPFLASALACNGRDF
jgi:hypothetical protein